MKPLVISLLLAFAVLQLHGQCNTTLNKLLPEQAVNNDDRFGNALAANGQFLVIGAENSDTLGILRAGIAYVYEKTPAGWAYRAMLQPSDPDEYAFFGTDVAIDASGNTIVVIDRLYPNNRVYVFEKPASGWQTGTESFKMQSPDFADVDVSVSITEDAGKIVLANPWSKKTQFFIFHKPAAGWLNSLQPETFAGPEFGFNANGFGVDILVKGDYIYVASDNDPSGDGIYVYKKAGESYSYLAKLSITPTGGQTGYFGRYLTATDDVIMTSSHVYIEGGDSGIKVFAFRKNLEWADATETIQFELPEQNLGRSFYYPIRFISSNEIAACFLVRDGDWYNGKVFVVRTTDGSWQDITSEVIYEEKGLTSRSTFETDMVWNGSELVRSAGSLPLGLTTRDAVVSLRRSGGLWGSLQHITVSRHNSASFFFGMSVHKHGETLFAAAPYDGTAGAGAGAVYVYEKSADSFQKIHTILPSARRVRADGSRDSGFGYSLFSYGDELAIGAPSYRYGTGRLGKIFLYRRTGTSWTGAQLYDSLSPPEELMLDHFGANLVMDGNFLFASAYNNLNDEHTNALVVFEKVNDKWTYKQMLKVGRPIDKSWPSVKLSLFADKLLVGTYRSFDGGISIFRRNESGGSWERIYHLGTDALSTAGMDVKLQENHFFVGVPFYPFQGILDAGAVLVYSKLPGEDWNPSSQPSAVIGARIPVKGGNFGSSLDVIGNTLVVGAPGSFLTDGEVRTVPGNTYIIQSKDYYWQQTTEFLNLQGDRYSFSERDHFGSDVGVDEENFYIGSRNENTTAGAFSGAVYYIPTPPVVFLIPPVCQGAGLVQLHGYPFNGTWSGPGISDPSGAFDPSLVNNGVFELTYTTPNCAFLGRLQVDVQTGPGIDRITPEEVALCSEDGVTLALTDVPDANYSWYFKPPGSRVSAFIGSEGPEKKVTNPGEYFAIVRGGTCSSESPLFSVIIEDVDLVIGPQPVVCNHNDKISLEVSVGNGVWEGTGVNGKEFHSGNLANGKYPLTFRFTTPKGCNLALKDTVAVRVIEPIGLRRSEADFCATGATNLTTGSEDTSLEYTWYHGVTMGQTAKIEKDLNHEATVFEAGYYHLSATNGDCTIYSDTLQVGFDTDLAMEIVPEEKTVIVCADDTYVIEAISRAGTTFSWYYQPPDQTSFELLANGPDHKFPADQSGYYKVMGEFGFCSFESDAISVQIKIDSLWAPNVFTPNGDDANERFQVVTNVDDYALQIFNRYGKPIHTSTDGIWDGRNAPAGTYFWQVNYPGCKNRGESAKGWVQLMR